MPAVVAGKRSRVRPPSPIGQALDTALQETYAGNKLRLAQALGVSRATLYDWMTKARPRIERQRHRDALAQVLTIDLRSVDTLIVAGLGYRVVPVRVESIALAVLTSMLDSEDIALLERQAQAMLRRNDQLRRGRRT
jgi:hypothetical protein